MNYTNQYYSNFLGWIVPFGLIPINEIYAWSNNEKIHILFHKIGELIKTSNIYGESMVEILKWIEDNKDAIKNTLAEMAESGELTDIVSDILNENPDIITDALARNPELLTNAVKEQIETMLDNGSLNDVLAEVFSEVNDLKHSKLDLSRKWRALFVAHSYNATTKEEELYSAMQGCCHFEYKGQGYVAMYTFCSNQSVYHYNDNGILRIYRDDGTFVVQKSESWGHCNSLAFDETTGYIYGAESSRFNSGTEANPSKRVFRVLFNGTSIGDEEVRTFTVAENRINGVMCYKGVLYICTNLHIYIADWNTYNVTNFLAITPPANFEHIAGWTRDDNYLYTGMYNGSSRLLRINLATKKIDWCYHLDRIQNNGMFLMGEIQGISLDKNNNLWVITFQRMQVTDNLTHHMSQVFVQNLTTNAIQPTVQRVHSEGTSYIFVSANGTQNPSNPNGTAENPFPIMQEAIWFGANATDIDVIRINVRRLDGYYVTLTTDKPVWISGTDTDTCGIGGIEIGICPSVYIESVKIVNHFRSDSGNEHNREACIYAFGCGALTILDCIFSNANSFITTSDKQGIYLRGGFCFTSGNTMASNIGKALLRWGHRSAYAVGQYTQTSPVDDK